MQLVTPPRLLYRVGRPPAIFDPPDWSYISTDVPPRGRFDDPEATYRVVYASSQRLGCFLETLAPFRVDPAVIAGFAEITAASDDDHIPFGVVPRAYFETREIASARVTGSFVDLADSRTIGSLRVTAADLCIRHGVSDVDLSSLCASTPRAFTQELGRRVYQMGYAGVRYISKFGADIENWAIFEPITYAAHASDPIAEDDEDILEAVAIHRLQMQGEGELLNTLTPLGLPRRV